jgi:hypothetical protein
MKKIILFAIIVFLSVSCKKSSNSDGSSVQYQFTSDVSATYTIEYSSDVDMVNTETFQGTSWSKTVTAKRNPGFANITTTRLVAYPPSTWTNTTTKAHVNLKILVNGNVKANTDTVMTASNVGGGIFEIYTF